MRIISGMSGSLRERIADRLQAVGLVDGESDGKRWRRAEWFRHSGGLFLTLAREKGSEGKWEYNGCSYGVVDGFSGNYMFDDYEGLDNLKEVYDCRVIGPLPCGLSKLDDVTRMVTGQGQRKRWGPRLREAFDRFGWAKHVVLTIPHQDLAGVGGIRELFSRIMGAPLKFDGHVLLDGGIKAFFSSGIVREEWKVKGDGLYLHFHVIGVLPRLDYGVFLCWLALLKDWWYQITEGKGRYVYQVGRKVSVGYITDYVTKSSVEVTGDDVYDAELLVCFAGERYRVRTLRDFGLRNRVSRVAQVEGNFKRETVSIVEAAGGERSGPESRGSAVSCILEINADTRGVDVGVVDRPGIVLEGSDG